MKFVESQRWFERAQVVTPGASQTGSKAPGRVGPLGAYPLALQKAEGSRVVDVDGNEFVDFYNGNCAVTLGHGDRDVLVRVRYALEQYGALPSLPTPLEAEVAERLVSVIPCAESVRFVKTGSEATEAAIRIARIVTGRDAIAVIGDQYNGWHSWSVARCATRPGVPVAFDRLLRVFRYNDLASLHQVMDSDVAAIVIEPTRVVSPAPGFLEGCRAAARQHGALLIFDEMITGARFALGGAQSMFGVTPDLATFGKAFANGFPLAFVCGPREFMDAAQMVSGTFGGEVAGLAACAAVLDRHGPYVSTETPNPIARMWDVGRVLMDAVTGVCRRLALPAEMVGYPCHPVLRWSLDCDRLPYVTALMQQELAMRGVLSHPSALNPSAAHSSADLEHTIGSFTGALTAIAGYLESKDLSRHLKGELLRPAFARPA